MSTPFSPINTRKMKYTGDAMSSMKSGNQCPTLDVTSSEDLLIQQPFTTRHWSTKERKVRPPRITGNHERNIGRYPLTSKLAGWVSDAFINYVPSEDALSLVQPFSADLHRVLEKERANSTGLHDLNLLELIYQVTLEVACDILIAATKNGNVDNLDIECHSSRAARDEHLAPWGSLLTGLVCDPPIISMFPFYLMMCQSFGLETRASQENYVYAALTGVDWLKGQNAWSDRFIAFENEARAAVPQLEDHNSGKDRSFWRIALAYLEAMNNSEHARKFTAPNHSYITTDLNPYLLMAARAFDTIGCAYMCSDGAAYLDNLGMDSLLGSAVPNDVMDLHTDILTGETRNLLRLLYPNGQVIKKTIQTMSTVLSGMLCELFRGHTRARFGGREDGRIAATSPPYSFCRARHRRIFEVMEVYTAHYPNFWDWTWQIYSRAKEQVTEAGVGELLANALQRGINQTDLLDSTCNNFFAEYFDMIEQRDKLPQKKQALGVKGELGEIIHEMNYLWHVQLLSTKKKAGWGLELDKRSDALLERAGCILSSKDDADEMYRFSIAYGRLSMALPYIAYHTICAIILTYGVIPLSRAVDGDVKDGASVTTD